MPQLREFKLLERKRKKLVLSAKEVFFREQYVLCKPSGSEDREGPQVDRRVKVSSSYHISPCDDQGSTKGTGKEEAGAQRGLRSKDNL